MKKVLLASVLAIASTPGYAAEAFDWEKYCGDDYGCDDRGDRGPGKFFEPPSQAELRACTKNGKLDYACLRDSDWGKLTDYKICFREEGGKLGGDRPQCDPSILGAIEAQCVQENFGSNLKEAPSLKEAWAPYHRCVGSRWATPPSLIQQRPGQSPDSPEEAMLKLRDAGLEPVKAEPLLMQSIGLILEQ
jgi:hypothetical protein